MNLGARKARGGGTRACAWFLPLVFGCAWNPPSQAQPGSVPGDPGMGATSPFAAELTNDALIGKYVPEPMENAGKGRLQSSAVAVARSDDEPVRTESGDGPVTFSGSWTAGGARLNWSGGTALLSGQSDVAPATRLTWIGWRDARGGVLQVYLDGVLAAELVTYSTVDAPTPFFREAVPETGSRALLLEPGGDRPAASTSSANVM